MLWGNSMCDDIIKMQNISHLSIHRFLLFFFLNVSASCCLLKWRCDILRFLGSSGLSCSSRVFDSEMAVGGLTSNALRSSSSILDESSCSCPISDTGKYLLNFWIKKNLRFISCSGCIHHKHSFCIPNLNSS